MMSMQAAFDLDRSMRLAIGRAATLRDETDTPVDVVVEDISHSGCLVRAGVKLTPGDAVSIGIPGLGARAGRIIRADHPHYGCAFLSPINTDDISIAKDADTIIHGDFAARPAPVIVREYDHEADMHRYPLRTRLAFIAGASVLLWVPILLTARVILA